MRITRLQYPPAAFSGPCYPQSYIILLPVCHLTSDTQELDRNVWVLFQQVEPSPAEEVARDAAPAEETFSTAADPEQAEAEPAGTAAAAEVHTLEKPVAEEPGKEELPESASKAAVEATLPAAGEAAAEEKPKESAATSQEGPAVEETPMEEQSTPVAQIEEVATAKEGKYTPSEEAPAGAAASSQEEDTTARASEGDEGSHANGHGKAPVQNDEAPAGDALPNDKAPVSAFPSGCAPVPNGTHAEAPEEDGAHEEDKSEPESAASPASSEASQADGGAAAGKVRLSLVDKFSEHPKPDQPVELPKAAASAEEKMDVQAESPDASCNAEQLEGPKSLGNCFSMEEHSPETCPQPPVDQETPESPEAALPPVREDAGMHDTSHDASQPSEGLEQAIAHSPMEGAPASFERDERDAHASPPPRTNETDKSHEAELGAATARGWRRGGAWCGS